MLRKLVLLVGSTLVAAHGFAQPSSDRGACSTVRLDGPGMPMESLHAQDQGGMGLCDHYAACDVLDAAAFYRTGRAPTARCSGIDIAARLTAVMAPAGGIEMLSIEQIVENIDLVGSCDAKAISNRLARAAKPDACEEIKFSLKRYVGAAAVERTRGSKEPHFCGISIDMMTKLYDAKHLLGQILEVPATLPAIAAEVQSSCAGKIRPIAPLAYSKVRGWDYVDQPSRLAALRAGVDRSLDAKRPMPAAIKYCAHALSDKDIAGINPASGKINSTLCSRKGLPGNHVSTVIARQFNTSKNRCEYLVQNTAGSICDGYEPDYTCEAGRVWVPSQALFRNVHTVLSFDQL